MQMSTSLPGMKRLLARLPYAWKEADTQYSRMACVSVSTMALHIISLFVLGKDACTHSVVCHNRGANRRFLM